MGPRWLLVGLLVQVTGCGLTLDYSGPDPQRRDASFGDATTQIDAARIDGAQIDAPVDDAAIDDAGTDAGTDADADDASTGCTLDVDCATGEICVSLCTGEGHCIDAGEPCALVPTCGCDGVLYGSLCEAHQAGVEAAEDASVCLGCGAGGTSCPIVGTACLGCPGTPPSCVTLPFPGPPCSDTPVCGCDGNTYAGNCEATAAGVLHATDGACAGTCVTSADCATGQYCERSGCGDVVGTCTSLPTMTTPGVCGCSGRRYRGSREALLREGLLGPCDHCPSRSPTCCADSADCAPTEACVGADHACTLLGVCEPLDALHDGTCWSDEDCGPGAACTSPQVCPCSATCFVADAPGTCVISLP